MTKKQLQQLLNNLANANNKAISYRNKLMKYCNDEFGFEPGDVDFDDFIDGVDGGGGYCSGMDADYFIQGMKYCIDRHKRNSDLK